MYSESEKNDKRAWIVGGFAMIGTGVGFVMLAVLDSGPLLVASVLVGIGLGLVIASRVSK